MQEKNSKYTSTAKARYKLVIALVLDQGPDVPNFDRELQGHHNHSFRLSSFAAKVDIFSKIKSISSLPSNTS